MSQKTFVPMSSAQPVKTVRLVGPAGEVVVNECDQTSYEAAGYKLHTAGVKGGGCPDATHDWKQYSIDQLRGHAKNAKLAFTSKTTDEELRDLLCKSGYVPSTT